MNPRAARTVFFTLSFSAFFGLSAGCQSAKDKCLMEMNLSSCRTNCESDGDMEGCNQLARGLHLSVDSASHTTEIRALFERACKGGLAVGCVNRGSQCNINGLHGPEEKAKPGIVCARKWYSAACKHGSDNGCQLADKYTVPAVGR